MEAELSLYTRQELTARRGISKQKMYRQRRLVLGLVLAIFGLVVSVHLLARDGGRIVRLGQHGHLAVIPHGPSHSEEEALASIPSPMLHAYRSAGAQTGISWQLLAAIGANESDHGLSEEAGIHDGVNSVGCCSGPAQICVVASCGETWQHYSVGVDGEDPSVYDPEDAFITAGKYLRALEGEVGNSPALLLAAYNAGPTAVLHHGGVPPYPETVAYVHNGLALMRALGD